MSARDRAAIRNRCTNALTTGPRFARAEIERLLTAIPDDLEVDRYGEGDVIKSLEDDIAKLLGKEACVFMPSGTMAQPIALRIHADERRLPVVGFHPKCHLELHEHRAYDRLHGLSAILIGSPNALITPADLESLAEPISALLLELPQREIGGLLPPFEEIEQIAQWAKAHNTALHLDGARLWECAEYYGRGYDAICAPFDSVYVSFYKTLGGIAGSCLAGSKGLIAQARIWQRRQGGNLVSLYPYVIAARQSLQRLERIPLYNQKARDLAARLSRVVGVEVTPKHPPTNMFHILLHGQREALFEAQLDIAEERGVWLFSRLSATESARLWCCELTCLDATLELETEAIAMLFSELIDRADHHAARG
jgi:threonine aldolase